MAKTVNTAQTVNALGESQAVQSPAGLPQALQQSPMQLKKRTLKKDEREEELQDAAGTEGVAAAADEAVVLAQASAAAAPVVSDGGVVLAQAAPAAVLPAAGSSAVAAGLTAGQMLAIGGGALLVAGAAGGGGSDPVPLPTFKLTSNTASVDEGGRAVFTLSTTNVPNGTQVAYTIRGVNQDDVSGGQMTGVAVIQGGVALIEVNLNADSVKEGSENLVIDLDGKSVSATVVVSDTSVPLPIGAVGDVDGVDGGVVVENAPNGTLVGITAAAVDPNAGDKVSYSLTTNPGDLFAIDTATGVVTVNGAIDYEVATEYSVTVKASSTDGSSTTKVLKIAVSNVNDNPVGPVVDVNEGTLNNLVSESADLGSTVGITASASDADRSTTIGYSLVGRDGGVYSGPFSIDPLTGVVSLSAALDYETATSHEILVKATSSDGSSKIQAFTVNVTNVNDNEISQIIDADPAKNEVSELARVGSVVGLMVAATDGDSGALVTYELVDNAEGRFAINQQNGLITVADVLDYETSTSHTVRVLARSSDGSPDREASFTIAVLDDGVFDFYLTPAAESSSGTDFADRIIGVVSNTADTSDSSTTYQSGDNIDGLAGYDTLQLYVNSGATVDRATVKNVEKLELSIDDAGLGGATTVYMTNWDKSLQNIDILSAKSTLTIAEQQTIAAVSISDQSTENLASSYDFRYAARVLDRTDDSLSLTVDNVNGVGGAVVTVAAGMEFIDIAVDDQPGTLAQPNLYASNINLTAAGVGDIDVTGGLQGQAFTLNADVATGADFNSVAFVGNMDLTSADIKTATFGAGDDTATITDQANDAASSYNLGEGNNTLTVASVEMNLNLAGDVTALSGNDSVTVNGNTIATLTARSTIDVGGSDNVTGNTVTITGDHQGDVIAGDGTDTVVVTGATAAGSTIAVNDGANTVTTGAHAGSITGGADRDIVTTAAAAGSIAVGNGFNTVTTAALSGSITGGDDQDAVTVASTAALSSINVVNGANTVTVTGAHAGAITGGTGTDEVSAASTAAASTIALGDELNTVTISGVHAGTITGGADRDVVTVGSVTAGVIRTLGGTDSVRVNGDMTNGTIDVGEGNGNTVVVTGNVTASAPTSILFGDGDNNSLTIGGSLSQDDVVFGNGAGNSFSIGGSVTTGADITLGTGGNTGTIAGAVTSGSTISFGTDAVGDAGADSLTIGNLTTASPMVLSTTGGANELVPDTATVIRMGGADDRVTLNSAGTSSGFVVESGGFIHGEGGPEDTVKVVTNQANNTSVIGRTQQQKVEIELFKADVNSYQPLDLITVSFGGVIDPVTYTVRLIDIVQGNGALTSQNIALGVAAELNGNGPFQALFGAAAIDGTANTGGTQTTSVYITSDAPLADVTITAAHGATAVPVTVMQISDTRVTGFENVELVINDQAASQAATTVQADFSLINSATPIAILLDSKVQRDATVETFTAAPDSESLANGSYTQYATNAAQTFDLDNLQGGEQITVRGNETTTVGNQQVARINIDDREGPTNGHQIGDEIVVTIGAVRMAYEVVAEDLADGATESVDADRIGAKVVGMINAQTAEHGFTAVLDTVATVDNVTDLGTSASTLGGYAATYPTGAWVTLTGALDLPAPAGGVTVAHTRTVVQTTDSGLSITGDTASATQNNWDIGAALNPANNQLLPGDVITVIRAAADGQPAGSASYTVTAADCLRLNADAIAADLASKLGGTAQATFGVIQFGGAANLLVTRTTEVSVAATQTARSGAAQAMTATDDGATDVIIDANLVATATNRTMDLTVDGYGAFDLAVVGNNGTTGFTDLALTLADGFDHTIDLNGGVYQMVGTPAVTVQGNFSNSVTVVDEGVSSTVGQNIVLSEVLARTVNTSGADANFTIDQYTGVRAGTPADFAGEVITVTTGDGNDHLRTLAQSALTDNRATPDGQQSSINLGTGSNTLSLGWGSGVILDSAVLAVVGNIDYSGDLTQLNIGNDVVLADGSTTVFRMPGNVGGVDVLTFTDVDVANDTLVTGWQAALTIEGAASTFRIESDEDLAEDGQDRIVLEAVGVENLSIEVGDEVNIELNGASLQTLEIIAGDDVDFVMDGSKTGNNNFVKLSAITLTADDNVDAVISHVRDGATLSVTGNADQVVDGEADVTVSHVTFGDVSVVSKGLSDFVELNVSGTVGTAINIAAASLGNVTVTSGADASLLVENNIDANVNVSGIDANVNVSGTVDISGLGIGSVGDAARLVVQGNTRANVSLADGGTINLEACGTDDNVRVTVAGNTNNFLPDFGNPDQAAVTNRSYAINLGAIQADAGEDAVVSLTDNDDDTYYGDQSVTIDSVDLFAYGDAGLTIGGATTAGNNSATIVIGTVDMVSQRNGTLAVTNNDGTTYVVTEPAFGTRRELDFADITIGNVTIDADAGNVTGAGEGDAFVTITDNDLARVAVGTIDVDAGGDATFRVDNNDDTTVTTLGVTINAEATATPTLTFSIFDNDRGDNGGPTVPLLASSVTINGDVNLTAPTTMTVIDIDDNDGLSATERSTVTVNGSFSSTSGGSITATISDNAFADINLGGNATAPVVNLTSTAGASTLTIDANADTSITMASTTLQANGAGNVARLDIGNVNAPGFVLTDKNFGGGNLNTDITLLDLRIDSNDNVAELLIRNNAGGANDTDVVVTGQTFIDGSTAANLSILGNQDANVDLSLTGTVKMDARAATGDVSVVISGNSDTTVQMGVLDADAADRVDVDIRTNTNTDVRTGNIDIDAGGAATFDVAGNTVTGTDIDLAVVRTGTTVTSRGTIAINAAAVGDYAAGAVPALGSWGFLVAGNAGSEVFLGDVGIVATDGVINNSNDVTLGVFAADDDRVDVGNITISADNDVYVQFADTDTEAVISTGDITISSGNEPLLDDDTDVDLVTDNNPDVSSHLYFSAQSLQGNNLNDNTEAGDNGQQITLTANSRGTGEGYVFAAVSAAPDLTTLTVSGTNAEVYLTGSIGADTAGTGVFTLDLSGLTGAFGTTASAFNPMGITTDNRSQADGSYVESWNANFGGDTVRVEVGSGGLVYNAQHSGFGRSPSYAGVNAVNDWNQLDTNATLNVANEGWFSLNGNSNARYLNPVVAQQSFSIPGVSGDPTGDGSDLDYMWAVQLQTDTQQFAAAINYFWDDGFFGSESWSRSSDVVWYEFIGGTYVAKTEAYVEGALGGVDITYSYGADATSVAATQVTITGKADGSAFDYIISGSQNAGDGGDREFEALIGGGSVVNPATTLGVAPVDGVGNVAKEVFVFTGSEVGEVVIGGFNPGAWGLANPANNRLTDRLDFTDFDWNGNGVADDAGLVNLEYFSFTVTDTDGYFADVVVDFIGGVNLSGARNTELVANDEFGSIRLVGVGEFDSAISLVQQSVIFA